MLGPGFPTGGPWAGHCPAPLSDLGQWHRGQIIHSRSVNWTKRPLLSRFLQTGKLYTMIQLIDEAIQNVAMKDFFNLSVYGTSLVENSFVHHIAPNIACSVWSDFVPSGSLYSLHNIVLLIYMLPRALSVAWFCKRSVDSTVWSSSRTLAEDSSSNQGRREAHIPSIAPPSVEY